MNDDLIVRVGAEISDFERGMARMQAELTRAQANITRMQMEGQSGISRLGGSAREAAGGFKVFGNRAVDTALGLAGFASVQGVLMGVNAVITDSVRVFSDFEQNVQNAAVIAGGDVKQNFAALSESAKSLGASTTKSASEVAIAMTEMSKKGFDANQTIAAMPGIIAASEASQEDLALVTDVATAALNSWGLEAKDTNHIADILAQTSNETSAGVKDMQYAFKYAAPFAKVLGLSVSDLSAMVGLLRDRGLSAEQIGTSLRMMMMRLAKPTEDASKAMKEVGMSLMDASGKMKPMYQVLGELEKKVKGMTADGAIDFLGTLFGVEAAPAVFNLLDIGVDKVQALSDKTNSAYGAAERQAKQMKNTYKGAVEEMKGAWETFQIKMGETWAKNGGTALVKGITATLNAVNSGGDAGEPKKKNPKSDRPEVEINDNWAEYQNLQTLVNFLKADASSAVTNWSMLTKKELDSLTAKMQESTSMWQSFQTKSWSQSSTDFAAYMQGQMSKISEHNAWDLSTYSDYLNRKMELFSNYVANSVNLDAQEKSELATNMAAYKEKQLATMAGLNQEQLALVQSLNTQTVEQQQTTMNRIQEIEQQKNQMILDETTANNDAKLALLKSMQDRSGKISEETANKFISDADKQYNGTVEKAQKQYVDTVAAIELMRSQGIIKSDDMKNKMIASAEATMTETISKSKKMKDEYINHINEMQKKDGTKITITTFFKNVTENVTKWINDKTGWNLGGGSQSRHAAGGIVSAPTKFGNRLLGEAGSEAIIPLSNKHRVKPFAQAVASQMGGANSSRGNLTVQVSQLVVREEADVERVARQLKDLQDRQDRAKGVITFG